MKREKHQSGKEINGTEPGGDMVASVVDVITMSMPVRNIKVPKGSTFISLCHTWKKLEKQLLFTGQTVADGTSTEEDAIFKQNM